jgi:polyisoprenoid-binding protein YceI
MSTSTSTTSRIPAGTYTVDPSHASVGFAVRHMGGIATVRGAFQRFQGTLDVTGESPVLHGTVEVASVSTGDEQRDGHLTSPDFFDVERHPEIRFHSTGLEPSEDGKVRLAGEITIKGITKPIELTGTIAAVTDPWGGDRVGLEVEGLVDRRDFEMNFNQVMPGGGVLVGNDVKLLVSAEAVKEA